MAGQCGEDRTPSTVKQIKIHKQRMNTIVQVYCQVSICKEFSREGRYRTICIITPSQDPICTIRVSHKIILFCWAWGHAL